MRHQHRVAGIAQQLEQQRVRLAGARRQRDAIGGDRRCRGGGSRRRPPRAPTSRPSGCGSYRSARGSRERLEQILRIGEAGAGRIGLRQVDDRRAVARTLAHRCGQRRARSACSSRLFGTVVTEELIQRLTSSTRSITSPSRMPSTTSMPVDDRAEHGIDVIEPRRVDQVRRRSARRRCRGRASRCRRCRAGGRPGSSRM